MKRHLGVFLPAMLSVALFGITMFWLVLPQAETAILAKKREMVREMTLTVWHLLSTYEHQEKAGQMSRAEAQTRALKRVRELRYGNDGKDYFWINDLDGRMLVHPYRSDLEGQDVRTYTDPKGARVFAEFVRVARERGDGFVSYLWQWKDEKDHQAEKTSHVRLFRPWGWVVGTGMYSHDVQVEMANLTREITLVGTVVWALVTLLAGYVMVRNLRVERERQEILEDLRESEERFRGASDGALDGIVMIDSQGRISFWNQAARNIFGYSAQEALGQDLHHLLAPRRYHARYLAAFQRFTQTGQGLIVGKTLEFTALRRDGSEFPLELSISALNLRGRWHAVGIVRDITRRKQAEQELEDREKLYRALFEKAGEANVLVKDRLVVDCNAETLRMFACRREQMVGQSVTLLNPESQRDGLESSARAREIEAAVMDGQPRVFEWLFRRLDGSLFDAEVSLTRIDLGADSLLLAVVRDISQRKQAESDLRRSEANLRKAQQIARMGNWVLGPASSHLTCSEEVARILEVDLEACQPTKEFFLSRVDPQDRARIANALDRALREGAPFYLEHAIRLDNGERRFVVLQGETETDEAGRPLQLLATIQDVTAARLAQAERSKLEAQLRQAQKLEAIGTLAGGIAHDFNNVLQGISGFNQLLLASAEIGPDNRERLEQIDQITQRAAAMVRRLLTLARKVDLKQERVDLNHEVGPTIQILEHTLPKMVRIQAALAPDLKPIIGDPGQIVQVLLNLANNARQAMPQGGDLVFRTYNATLAEAGPGETYGLPPGAYVCCQVADTGSGMDPETQTHIFEPFFTTKPMGEGSGLGLSTVYGIVANHGGRIICESLPGQGATFTIYFPALADEAAAAVETPALAPAVSGEGGGETVLVVDDEEGILAASREALASLGYRVLTAASGESAMDIFGADPMAIDLVVLDLGMPGLGGLDCLRLMRSLRAEVKVLVATGYADDADLERLREQGVREVIAKPYRFTELASRIKALLADRSAG